MVGNPGRVVRHRNAREPHVVGDEASGAVIVRRLDGTIKYWDRNATVLYGWTPEEVEAKVTHHLLHTTFPVPLARIQGELESHGRWEGTLVHLRRDGVRMIVRSRWELRKGDGEVDVIETNQLAS